MKYHLQLFLDLILRHRTQYTP